MRLKLSKIRYELVRFLLRQEGQDLVEYALVIALISVAAVTSLHTLANKIIATFTAITSGL
jgi:Flp pilus assembly pilin Flp